MATLATHLAIGAALAAAFAPKELRSKATVAGAVVACAPDLDVLAFALRIPYAASWGHRGMTHSLLAALCWPWRELLGCAASGRARWWASSWLPPRTACSTPSPTAAWAWPFSRPLTMPDTSSP